MTRSATFDGADGLPYRGSAAAASARRTDAICALPGHRAIAYALAWQIVSFALLAAQLVLFAGLGIPTLLLGVVVVTVLYLYLPLAGATVFLQLLLYQNVALSLFSPLGIDSTGAQVFQGFSFILVAALATVSVFRTLGRTRSGLGTTATYWVIAAVAIAVLYTAYGATKSSPTSSLAYFRNTSAMLLALLVGIDLGRTWHYRTFAIIFLVSIVFGVGLSGLELFFPREYYQAVNAVDFANLKMSAVGGEDAVRSVDDIIAHRVVPWFNITGGAGNLVSVRIAGPNGHPVSNAYVLAAAGIVGATLGRVEIIACILVLLLVVAIKGPLLMFVITVVLQVFWCITRSRNMVLVASLVILVAYVGEGIRVGLASGDFHVIGLLGGLHGFITMPIGHGIGVGGNLSAQAVKGLDWSTWQKMGVDFALESAVGVLLYQMGISAIAVYAPLFLVVVRGLGARVVGAAKRGPQMTDALFIGVAVTMANGFFQEEAYSPYAIGILTLLAGIAISNREAEGKMFA